MRAALYVRVSTTDKEQDEAVRLRAVLSPLRTGGMAPGQAKARRRGARLCALYRAVPRSFRRRRPGR